jgi:hypothetical protein
MNSSFYIFSLDPAGHLRVVAIALIISIAIVGLSLTARVGVIDETQRCT